MPSDIVEAGAVERAIDGHVESWYANPQSGAEIMGLEDRLMAAGEFVDERIDAATRATARAIRWSGRVACKVLRLVRLALVYLNLLVGFAILASYGHEITTRAPDPFVVGIGIVVGVIGLAIVLIIVTALFLSGRDSDGERRLTVPLVAFLLNLSVVTFTAVGVRLQSPGLAALQVVYRDIYSSALYIARAMASLVRLTIDTFG